MGGDAQLKVDEQPVELDMSACAAIAVASPTHTILSRGVGVAVCQFFRVPVHGACVLSGVLGRALRAPGQRPLTASCSKRAFRLRCLSHRKYRRGRQLLS